MIPYYPLGVYKDKEVRMNDEACKYHCWPASADRACCSSGKVLAYAGMHDGQERLLAALLRPGDARRHGQLLRRASATSPSAARWLPSRPLPCS